MKKKNFLRNLSTTALAICCLSSAVAFSSFASLNKGPKLTLTQSFGTGASFPVVDDEGNVVFKGDNHCTLTFEADNVFSSSMSVTGATENNNGVVFIPTGFQSIVNGNEVKVTKVNSDAKFLNTKTLVVPGESEFDETEIRKNNPKISSFYIYGNNKA